MAQMKDDDTDDRGNDNEKVIYGTTQNPKKKMKESSLPKL